MPRKSQIDEKAFIVVNLIDLYGSEYVGNEKYILFTDLSEEELDEKYAVEIIAFRPFFIMSKKAARIFNEYQKNEKKFRARSFLETSLFDRNDNELIIPVESAEISYFKKVSMDELMLIIKKLPEIQQRRFVSHYVEKMTYDEIAEIEKVDRKAIMHSVALAMKKIRKIIRY